ncbi:Phage putative head morphogenesis protein, SPP1 gp7 (plasmid) [Bacillus thuringiensis serovar chinensis CT-43]|nr:Phage putative head morphogenesis protein, SPP1 gp7 [Bacillus thuringiensis serovar chinensis CT-43]
MKPVRVYFVCSFLRGLYCLKVCSFQLMENRRVSILKLMGMWRYPYKGANRNKKTWLTGNDERVCKECGGLHGETVDIDDLFSNGKMCPPAHPHCRCTMVSEE